VVTKSRRALSTLVLPVDIKETILADAQEFLVSGKWYQLAGIPHRRGQCIPHAIVSVAEFVCPGYLLRVCFCHFHRAMCLIP
jgi:hypothetical protein